MSSPFPPGATPSGTASVAAAPRTGLSGDLALDIEHLTKVYRTARRRVVAVDNLSLHVPRTGVHGFLGPNGSGKTTTIRMVLGLVRANSGVMRIFGEQVPERLPAVIGRVGSIVEQPKFFPSFTARQNLRLAAETIGVPRGQADRVLEQVGLKDRADDRFRTYSLGMKQRLAIAGTLLKSPDLLIFDEPTNGLDPAGIQEIRETIRGLGQQGHCVLVSSHILSEVQQVADTVSIIGRGRLLAEGRVDDLMTGGTTVRVRVPDAARAAQLLQQAGFPVRPDADSLLVEGSPDSARVNETLARAGLFASEVVVQRRDLEQVFLDLTRGETPNSAAGSQQSGGGQLVDAPGGPASAGPAGPDSTSAGPTDQNTRQHPHAHTQRHPGGAR